ncbi:hypothetical protein E5D57_002581 [Metarhizium anisopliae]|nr:hypothetical protein E5D57_002581 [Metarhizium anisopliae]
MESSNCTSKVKAAMLLRASANYKRPGYTLDAESKTAIVLAAQQTWTYITSTLSRLIHHPPPLVFLEASRFPERGEIHVVNAQFHTFDWFQSPQVHAYEALPNGRQEPVPWGRQLISLLPFVTGPSREEAQTSSQQQSRKRQVD